MLGMVTQVFVTFNEELPKYMEYCFYLLHDTKAYFEFDRWRGTEWEKKQGQRPREREAREDKVGSSNNGSWDVFNTSWDGSNLH